jgi:hypothetical protein
MLGIEYRAFVHAYYNKDLEDAFAKSTDFSLGPPNVQWVIKSRKKT